jgi:hypothetical protein
MDSTTWGDPFLASGWLASPFTPYHSLWPNRDHQPQIGRAGPGVAHARAPLHKRIVAPDHLKAGLRLRLENPRLWKDSQG